MNVTAGIAAATMLAGAAVGFASPARAADFSGTFIPNGPGMQSTWVVTPCGRDCARIADSTGWCGRPPVGRVLEIRGGSAGRDEVQQRRCVTGNGDLQG